MLRDLLVGAAAGAAGTAALDAVTYADMVVRGRPASRTPQQTVDRAARLLHVRIPGHGARREARLTGLGALGGYAVGTGVGAAYGVLVGRSARRPVLVDGLLLAGAAMVVANGPMTVLGITDPRAWSRMDWASDVLPHLAYGLVVAATVRAARG